MSWQFEDESTVSRPHSGETPEMIATLRANRLPASPELRCGSGVLGGEPVHILDVRARDRSTSRIVGAAHRVRERCSPYRCCAKGESIGSLTIWRDLVRPFTEQQIELLETFADQAVIAIENVRLFKELRSEPIGSTETDRDERDPGVIASSPTDLQPVLDTIAESAARLCDANDAVIRLVAGRGDYDWRLIMDPYPVQADERPIDRELGDWPGGGRTSGRFTLTICCGTPRTEFPETCQHTERLGIRTLLAVPLLRERHADRAPSSFVARKFDPSPRSKSPS